MSGLEGWIRSHLPLERVALDQAVAEARRLARAAGLDETRWLERLITDTDLLERLRSAVVPPESWLFRHLPAFDAVREHLAGHRGTPRRILSLGCARGAEPFSLAATAHAAGLTPDRCEIVAVDWSHENLRHAETGTCLPLAQRGPIPEWARSCFEPGRDGAIQLRAELLRMIRWVHADIAADPMPQDCDVVFCRNAAIYLSEPARLCLARTLRSSVRAGGMLCLGHADPTVLWKEAFRPLSVPGAFAFERSDAQEAAMPDVAAPTFMQGVPMPATVPATRAFEPRLAPTVPSDPSLERARMLADAGSLDAAAHEAERLLAAAPIDPAAWHLMATIRLAQRQDADAEACFRKVVYLKPDDVLSLLQLSALAERRGDMASSDRYRLRVARAMKEDLP